MYKLVVNSKRLLDENTIEANCSFFSGADELRKDIIVRSTVTSFEGTALEVAEKWARSFDCLNVVSKELDVDLKKIDAEREAQRKEEARVAAEAVKIAQETVEETL